MIAVDTNVVVRLLVGDDATQARRARALFETAQEIFVSPSVLLECIWVLRAAYGHPPDRIATFLRAVLGLPGVRTAEPERVADALKAYASGMDGADALHLAMSQDAERFYTFDTAFRHRAARVVPTVPVHAP